MILCKLTDQNLQTHNRFQWVLGEWAPAIQPGRGLCSDRYYHCYEHPYLATLLNPIHARFEDPRLWAIEVAGKPLLDGQMKRGYKSMRLTKELEIPEFTLNQRIAFGIYCALDVYSEPGFVEWANNWLDRKYKGKKSVAVAAAAAVAAEDASLGALANMDESLSASALSASWAAEAVVRSAASASALASAQSALAAEAASWVDPMKNPGKPIDLISIAKHALKFERGES